MAEPKRIALVYIGDEQLSWARQAFAMSRHYYVMPGILYLKARLDEQLPEIGVDSVECIYFNRALHDIEVMVSALADLAPGLVGFSCYSWNLVDSLRIAEALRHKRPSTRIILGGPEVTFPDTLEPLQFMRNRTFLDAIVLGEGEAVIADVARDLLNSGTLRGLPNVVWREGREIGSGERSIAPVDLADVPKIDPLSAIVPRTAGTGRAIIYQTYRGCPNACAYCSFHGGAKGIRRFPLTRVEQELKALFAARVELINFADAVFDISAEQAKNILRLCIEYNRETSLLCYAAFQNMDEELASLLEEARIQVGIGLQSVHEDVLKSVNRHFRVGQFFRSLTALGQRQVNYYVDLMYGLPQDSPAKFKETFNQVMLQEPPFVMPFPLTIIPRSELAHNLEGFGVKRLSREIIEERVRPMSGMVYQDIGLHQNFDLKDLRSFDDIATAIFFVFQRYPLTLNALVQYAAATKNLKHGIDPYRVFEEIGLFLRECLGGKPIDIANPPRIEGQMREAFRAILVKMGGRDVVELALENLMRLEAGIFHLMSRPDRRAHWEKIEKYHRAEFAKNALDDESSKVVLTAPSWMTSLMFSYEDLHSLGTLRERIQSRPTKIIALSPYDDWRPRIYELSDLEAVLLEQLESGKAVRLSALLRQMNRHGNREQSLDVIRRCAKQQILVALPHSA